MPHQCPSPTRRCAVRSAALVLPVLLLVSACGSGTTQDVGAPRAASAVQSAAASPSHEAHTAPPGARPAASTTQAAPGDAVALRSRLEELLGAHVLLADQLVRARLNGQEAQSSAAADAVAANQQQLVDLVTSAGGAAVGQEFEAAWQRHVELLGDYANALRQGDTAAAQAGRAAYAEVEQQLAAALSTVVGGTLPGEVITAGATVHGEHLLDQADAYAAGDYDRAYTIQREAFRHMIAVADVLARGVATATGQTTAELDAPRRELQTALSRLLAEHMGLMVQAMRAAHDAAPELPAAGQALNANTAELGGAINALYGEPASREFLALWARHVEGLMLYARSADDAAAQDRARAAQVAYAPELARFLAGATEQRLPSIDLAAALTVHDDQLLDQADAYAADDQVQAQLLSDQGYAHMFALAQTLATAVGDTVAERLPQGGAATGGGGSVGRR